MPRYAQLVMGPAGSGKSTFCNTIVEHCENIRRPVQVVNLDPAAEAFSYPVTIDIRDLISVDDVMEDEELRLGPNGGLVFCMEYFARNFEWLEEQLGEDEDDYILFDCPGQVELYTHIPVMRQLVDTLQNWNFRICGVFIVDSQFIIETAKFFSGVLVALSTMVNLEIPHISVMSKIDLLNKSDKNKVEKYLDPNPNLLLEDMDHSGKGFHKLNKAIANLIEDYSLVNFLPMDISDEETIGLVLSTIDNAIQYGEDLEVKVARDQDDDED